MRATLGGLLLLKLVAGRLTSCVNGPGWTPWADKEVAHKGDGPGLKETSHATKEKDGRGNKYVNQYLIIHKIGQTSWSKVKLCLNTTDFSPYVIKEVRKSHLCGAAEGGPGSAGSSTVSAEARIKKEVAIIKKLDHPKIVAFHEVSSSNESADSTCIAPLDVVNCIQYERSEPSLGDNVCIVALEESSIVSASTSGVKSSSK